MLATVAADGVITEDELTGFINAVNRMSMFRSMGQAGFSKLESNSNLGTPDRHPTYYGQGGREAGALQSLAA
ncbi:hypothetical protein DYH09_14530 [bacterium CPR1]|nr:hypothetical protein [bacterium CPR1]